MPDPQPMLRPRVPSAVLPGDAEPPPAALGDYQIGAELGRGAMSVVYRATRGERAFAIKLMSVRPAADAVDVHLQFRREAAAVARLEHPALVRVVELGEYQGRPYLVMELAEGESLDRRIARQALDDDETLAIATSIAGALGEVHRFRLIHRDIKPANIIVSAAGTAKLVDFGLVTGSAESEAVVGTLHYAAPEQVGVLKRAVGAPADLYALGATLFECLAGAPPLTAVTQSDFLHKLATQPVPDLRAQRPATRPGLAAVIAKLLSKDPDDRYQSARGLLADLGNLAQIEAGLTRSGALSLGSHDSVATVEEEIPLIGRKEELGRLRRCWQDATQGQAAFAQIEGENGSGKTRLARELSREASRLGAVVLSGKCEEFDKVPFGPLREAADQYAAKTLRLPDLERAEAVRRLRDAAGDRAPLVKRLSVGLATLLGESGEMRALEPDAEEQRYYESLASFFRNLGTAAAPLVLLVDDLQWIDEGSLRVLAKIAAGTAPAHLLVLSTTRNGPDTDPARSRYARAIGESRSERIDLKPLRLKAVHELISAQLGGKPLDPSTVEKLASMTNGNPFAVGEYLRALLDAGILRPARGRWHAAAAIDSVTLPKDVVELIVARLFSLGRETSRIASLAGLVGERFSLALLSRVAGSDAQVTARAIEELVRAGLVEQTDLDTYAFVHGRVRTAAAERLQHEQLRDAHQAIAEALEATSDPSPNHLFALARHYAMGHTERDPRRVAAANFAAGLRALEYHANESAFELLDRAREMARRAGSYDELAVRLLEGLGRACAMTGRHDRAFECLEEALRRARGREDRFRLQYLLTLTYASHGRNDDALEALYQAFDVIGRPFPKWAFVQFLMLVGVWILAIALRVSGLGFGRAAGKDRERRQTLSQLHYAGSMIALFQGRPFLMVQFIVRDFLNVHFLGPTAESAIAYSVYGAVLGTFQLRSVMERYTKIGIGIAERIGDAAALAVCRAYQAVGTKWAGDLVRGNRMLVEALPELHRQVPGSWYTAMMICEQAYSYLHGGHSREALAHIEASAANLDLTNNLMFRYNTRSVQYAQMMVVGEVAEAAALWERLQEQFGPLANTIYVRLARCIALLEVMVDQSETGAVVDEAIAAFQGLLSEDYYSNAARVLEGHARLAQYLAAKGDARKQARRRLLRATFALSARAMVPVFKCHALVLRAALARTDGKPARARRLLERADQLARACQSRNGAYYVALERARLAAGTGDASAPFFATIAFEIATAEGWRQKARRVRAEFDLGERQAAGAASAAAPVAPTTVARSIDQSRRYADALLQVSLASASTLDPEVQARNALTEVARLLGAERALFFLIDDQSGELVLKASTGVSGAHFSDTVVKRVLETRAPVVLSGSEEGDLLGSQSIVAYGLRSILAAPLLIRARMIGVVYLDSRLAKGMFTADDVSLLLGVSNHIAIAVETARTARLEAERFALQRDLELLGAVQSLLLPKRRSFEAPGVAVAGFYQPAAQSGGDWWWYDASPDGTVLILVGDVSGHGASSAMITSAVAGAVYAMRASRDHEAGPRAILRGIDQLVRSFGGGFHMTMAAVQIDPRHRQLTLLGAGAPAILLRTQGRSETLAAAGQLLGGSDEFAVGEITAPFGPGDRLLLCTDGVLELKGPKGRELGAKRMARIFSRLDDSPFDGLPAQLGAELNAMLTEGPQDDDLTFVVVEGRDPAVPTEAGAAPPAVTPH